MGVPVTVSGGGGAIVAGPPGREQGEFAGVRQFRDWIEGSAVKV
jgi:hypothetical protein